MTTYRELQATVKALRTAGNVTPPLNSKRVVLEEYLANPEAYTAPAKSAPKAKPVFDWEGLATDRKDAMATLKAFRAAGADIGVKLNATNVALKAALEKLATAAETPTPTVTLDEAMGAVNAAHEAFNRTAKRAREISASVDLPSPLLGEGEHGPEAPLAYRQAWAAQMVAKNPPKRVLQTDHNPKTGVTRHRMVTIDSQGGRNKLGTWY